MKDRASIEKRYKEDTNFSGGNKSSSVRGGGNTEYRPLSSVSDDLDVAHLRGGQMHNSSMSQTQPVKRIKTEIVTTGRRHNFEIQPSRYKGSSQSHLGQLPSIEGTGSAVASKTGYKSDYP